jgi:hypothetical protein
MVTSDTAPAFLSPAIITLATGPALDEHHVALGSLPTPHLDLGWTGRHCRSSAGACVVYRDHIRPSLCAAASQISSRDCFQLQLRSAACRRRSQIL